MLKLYDYLEAMMEEQDSHQWFIETKLNYFAGDIMEILAIENVAEIASSINRAVRACRTMGIPFSSNFKRVYRFDGKNLIADWKMSSLACYLLIINCNPCHQSVAKAQLYFAMNQAARR